ncbi:MAG: T9SS type A sorting domain-containing protein [Chitinophagales bacterium]|jgi:hypothetical protein|nr:T9SS type A sorting domain-containing protein [Chitinophagales bacterium]
MKKKFATLSNKYTLLAVICYLLTTVLQAQNSSPFNIALEPMNIDQLGGIQSYAVGQSNGKWLIVGGRLDGLHRRQPWAAFDIDSHNTQFIVVDPVVQQKWTAPLTTLPTNLQEQLSSTNMEFYQSGDYLYCVGGYGYSATIGDHTTYPYLTAIKVSDVINAIIANTDFANYVRQIEDSNFQVTGGKLKKINDVYHLLGGQKFIGRYNPMGPDHGSGFVQEYTNAVRRFTLSDNGTTITINHLPAFVDAENLHRRDYNAEPQILPNGEEGITMFSGVFQPTIDLPYLNAVTLDSDTYTVEPDFQQYYNHYHCATLPLYSAANNEMHTVFFGGIAQYYDGLGVLVQDNNVPFVKTIARVTRNVNGMLAEYKLPIEMPALLGAGSELILNPDISHYNNDVVNLDQVLTAHSTLVGYIFGGISSTASNIFWSNDGTQSSTNSQIFKVYLTQGDALSIHDLNEQGIGTLKMVVYPNPNDGEVVVKYYLKNTKDVKLSLVDLNGKVLEKTMLKRQQIGTNLHLLKIPDLNKGDTYLLTIETPYEKATQKIILQR